MLATEHAAGASHAGLHLVEDQQQAVLIAQRAQRAQEIVLGHYDARLTLDRLDHDGDRLGPDGAPY